MSESRSVNVLIQTAFLGDLLLSIPLMKKIKAMWPEQALILVCRKGVGEFFAKTGLVDQVLEVQKGDTSSYHRILKALGVMKIENVFSPHESLRTAFFVRELQASKKIGFKKFWNAFFFDERVQKNLHLPDALRQLSLLWNIDPDLRQKLTDYTEREHPYDVSEGGRLPSVPAWATMSLRDFYIERREEILKLQEKLGLAAKDLEKSVVLFPGSVWATKRWTEEGFVHLGQALRAEGVPVLVMGGPGEEELCARVSDKISGSQNLCAKTSIYESALVLSGVAAVVGNDSASMHLAATSETPSVVIFGPTVLQFGFRPWQNRVSVVERAGMTCRPCGKHGHRKCPIGTHACMKEISKEDVLEKLRGLLPS